MAHYNGCSARTRATQDIVTRREHSVTQVGHALSSCNLAAVMILQGAPIVSAGAIFRISLDFGHGTVCPGASVDFAQEVVRLELEPPDDTVIERCLDGLGAIQRSRHWRRANEAYILAAWVRCDEIRRRLSLSLSDLRERHIKVAAIQRARPYGRAAAIARDGAMADENKPPHVVSYFGHRLNARDRTHAPGQDERAHRPERRREDQHHGSDT
eukprot:scaffold18410_cov30-Tisochrysis_lutea.AAC.2